MRERKSKEKFVYSWKKMERKEKQRRNEKNELFNHLI
jgi:hypothetical protein